MIRVAFSLSTPRPTQEERSQAVAVCSLPSTLFSTKLLHMRLKTLVVPIMFGESPHHTVVEERRKCRQEAARRVLVIL